jgi:hypothetical protein
MKILKLKNFLLIVVTLILLGSCQNTPQPQPKEIIFKADRESAMGWVYIIIYKDSTFKYVLATMRSDAQQSFSGNVAIHNDSLYFHYTSNHPESGNTAIIFNKKILAFLDSDMPERFAIRLNKLDK